MGKYDQEIKDLVTHKLKSTNKICKELKEITKKQISWDCVYRVLFDLSINGKIEKIETDNAIYWKK